MEEDQLLLCIVINVGGKWSSQVIGCVCVGVVFDVSEILSLLSGIDVMSVMSTRCIYTQTKLSAVPAHAVEGTVGEFM
jgi:hypothetical protein